VWQANGQGFAVLRNKTHFKHHHQQQQQQQKGISHATLVPSS
jgi:hypothetical protein